MRNRGTTTKNDASLRGWFSPTPGSSAWTTRNELSPEQVGKRRMRMRDVRRDALNGHLSEVLRRDRTDEKKEAMRWHGGTLVVRAEEIDR